MSVEAVVCNQQQGTGILLVIVNLSLLSVVVFCQDEATEAERRNKYKQKIQKSRIFFCSIASPDKSQVRQIKYKVHKDAGQ